MKTVSEIAEKIYALYNTSKDAVFNADRKTPTLYKRYLIILLANEIVLGNVDKKKNYGTKIISDYSDMTQGEISNAIFRAKVLKARNQTFREMYLQCKVEIK